MREAVGPFHRHIWGDWNPFCQMLIKKRTTALPPSEVRVAPCPWESRQQYRRPGILKTLFKDTP